MPADLLAKVRRIEIMTDRLVTETFAGEYLSVFKGRGMEFTEVREYSPGDDVRTIDWNVTARLGRPFVKRYTEERELTAVIACDLSGSQFFGSGKALKKEVSAEIAAVLAFSALQNNDKAGLFLFTDGIEEYVPPKKGRKHVLHIIRDVLAFEPERRGTDLAGSLETMVRVLKRSSILFLISDFREGTPAASGEGRTARASGDLAPLRQAPRAANASPEGARDARPPASTAPSERLKLALKLASIKHDVVPVLVTDPRERALPRFRAFLELDDPESGQRVLLDASDSGGLASFKRAEEARLAGLEKLFGLCGLEHIRVDTAGNFIDPIVRFFQKRALRLRR